MQQEVIRLKKILTLFAIACSWAANAQADRSIHDIEQELKRIIIVDFPEAEAIARRANIKPLITGARRRTQLLYKLSECGIESQAIEKDWGRRATRLIEVAQSSGSKELEMYARFCRAFSYSMLEDSDSVLKDANIIANWAEQNLPAYKSLAFANRIRLLAYKKSTLYTAADSYRDFIIGLRFAEGPSQLAETKVALADLLILLNDFDQAKPLFKEIEQHLSEYDDIRTKIEYYLTLSVFHRKKKEYIEALDVAKKATVLAEQGQLSYLASIGYIYQTLIYGELGNIAEALKVIESLPEENSYLSGNRRKMYVDLGLAQIYSSQNELEKALIHAEAAYEFLLQLPPNHYHIVAAMRFAELLIRAQQWQKAAQVYQHYVSVSTQYLEQIQTQHNNVSSLRLKFEQQHHMKQQASLEHLLQQQQINSLEVKQKWQSLAVATSITLLLVMTASSIHYRTKNKRYSAAENIDVLTRLANRTEITSLAEQALKRARKSSHTMTLGILDIDGFRRVNDSFGIEVGDQILFEVASTIHFQLADKGIMGRFDGDAFLLIFPELTTSEAVATCSELVEAIRQTQFDETELALTLTASVGLASSTDEAVSLSTLLTRAEASLLQAKQKGIGQVEVSNI